jgi:hypothetical protein
VFFAQFASLPKLCPARHFFCIVFPRSTTSHFSELFSNPSDIIILSFILYVNIPFLQQPLSCTPTKQKMRIVPMASLPTSLPSTVPLNENHKRVGGLKRTAQSTFGSTDPHVALLADGFSALKPFCYSTSQKRHCKFSAREESELEPILQNVLEKLYSLSSLHHHPHHGEEENLMQDDREREQEKEDEYGGGLLPSSLAELQLLLLPLCSVRLVVDPKIVFWHLLLNGAFVLDSSNTHISRNPDFVSSKSLFCVPTDNSPNIPPNLPFSPYFTAAFLRATNFLENLANQITIQEMFLELATLCAFERQISPQQLVNLLIHKNYLQLNPTSSPSSPSKETSELRFTISQPSLTCHYPPKATLLCT